VVQGFFDDDDDDDEDDIFDDTKQKKKDSPSKQHLDVNSKNCCSNPIQIHMFKECFPHTWS